jgi:hypothetical protein
MREIEQIVDGLEPAEVLAALAPIIKKNLAHLDEEARTGFVTSILDESNGDKLSSMVNL